MKSWGASHLAPPVAFDRNVMPRKRAGHFTGKYPPLSSGIAKIGQFPAHMRYFAKLFRFVGSFELFTDTSEQ